MSVKWMFPSNARCTASQTAAGGPGFREARVGSREATGKPYHPHQGWPYRIAFNSESLPSCARNVEGLDRQGRTDCSGVPRSGERLAGFLAVASSGIAITALSQPPGEVAQQTHEQRNVLAGERQAQQHLPQVRLTFLLLATARFVGWENASEFFHQPGDLAYGCKRRSKRLGGGSGLAPAS